MAAVRHDITFTGTVQGVGFRYTACRIAERHGVTGWVRNQPDGSVRCVVEGPEADVRSFITELQDQMRGHVENTRIQTAEPSGEFHGFTVRR